MTAPLLRMAGFVVGHYAFGLTDATVTALRMVEAPSGSPTLVVWISADSLAAGSDFKAQICSFMQIRHLFVVLPEALGLIRILVARTVDSFDEARALRGLSHSQLKRN